MRLNVSYININIRAHFFCYCKVKLGFFSPFFREYPIGINYFRTTFDTHQSPPFPWSWDGNCCHFANLIFVFIGGEGQNCCPSGGCPVWTTHPIRPIGIKTDTCGMTTFRVGNPDHKPSPIRILHFKGKCPFPIFCGNRFRHDLITRIPSWIIPKIFIGNIPPPTPFYFVQINI